MTALLDTGPLVAYIDEDDPHHAWAVDALERTFRGERGVPLSADLVLDEGLTLLRRRPGRRAFSEAFSTLFWGPWEGGRPFEVRFTDRDRLLEATRLHFQHYDRGLSLTDCGLLAHARAADAVLVTLDKGFDGLVNVVRP